MENESNPGAGNGVATIAAPTSPSMHPVYSQINDFFKQHVGRDATPQEYSQWGTNVDPQYMANISNAIYNTKEAQDYRTKQSAPKSAAGPDVPTTPETPPASAAQPASPVTSTGKIAPPAPQATALAPPQLPSTPMPTYQAQKITSNYTPDQFTQFAGPNQAGLSDPTSNLLKAIVANPQTMNAGIVSQLKEKSKEEALAMRDQAMQQYGQGAVARGAVGGGDSLAFNQNATMDTINKVLNSNRDVDVHAASQNRADELAAAQAADSFLSGQMGRATSAFGATNAGENSRANANQFGAKLNFDTQTANADQAFKQYQSEQAANESAVARALSQYGITSDAARFNEATRQFGMGHDLDIQKFLESQRQFNDQLGFNYTGLDQGANSNLMSLIQSIINRG